jgi:hypothetical protein
MATDLGQGKVAAPAKYDAFVAAQLARAQRRILFFDLTAGLLGFLAILLTYAAVMATCDKALTLSDVTRQTALALFALTSAVYLWLTVGRPLWRGVNPYFAARRMEQILPGSKNSVVNWLDLSRQTLPPAIRGAVGQRAAKDLAKADLEKAITGRRTAWVGAVTGLVGVIFLVLLFRFGSEPFFSLLRRAFAPFAGFSGNIASGTRLTVLRPDGGNVTVPSGRPVTITVEVEGKVPNPQKPDALKLHLRYEGSGTQLEPRPLVREDGREWSITIPGGDVQTDFTYKVTGGDAETPEYRVSVRSTPAITGFQATYHYRAYVGRRPEVRRERKLQAWRGTEVTLRVRTNRRVQSGHLEFISKMDKANNRTLNVRPVEDDPQAFEATLRLEESGHYRLHFTSTEEETYGDLLLYPVVADPDQPPHEVKLTTPGKDGSLPANGVLKVAGTAKDDIGVKDLALHLRVLEGPNLRAREFYANKDLPLAGGGYPLKVEYQDNIDLTNVQTPDGKPFELKAGMELEYWLEARDACDYPKPNEPGQSEKYRLRLTEPQDAQKQKQQRDEARKEQQEHEKKLQEDLKQEAQKREDEARQQKEEQDRQGDKQKDKKEGGDKGNKGGGSQGSKSEGGSEQEKKDRQTADQERRLKEALDRREQKGKGKGEPKPGEPKPGPQGKEGGQAEQRPEHGQAKPEGKPGDKKEAAQEKGGGEQGPTGEPSAGKGGGQAGPMQGQKGDAKGGDPKAQPDSPPAEGKPENDGAPPPAQEKQGGGAGKGPPQAGKEKPAGGKPGQPAPSADKPAGGTGTQEEQPEPKSEGKGQPAPQPKAGPKSDGPKQGAAPEEQASQSKGLGQGPMEEKKPGAGKPAPEKKEKGDVVRSENKSDRQPEGDDGPPKTKEERLKEFLDLLKDFKGDDPRKRDEAKRKLEEAQRRNQDLQSKLEKDLKSEDPKKREEAKRKLEEMEKEAKNPKVQEALRKAEEELTNKGRQAGENKQGPEPGEGTGAAKSTKDLETPPGEDKGRTEPNLSPSASKGKGKTKPQLGMGKGRGKKTELVPRPYADQDDLARWVGQLQLEDFSKIDRNVLKDAGLDEASFRKFLADRRDLLRRHPGLAGTEKLPPSQRGKGPSIGGERVERGGPAGDLRTGGHGQAPPGFGPAYSNFLNRMSKPVSPPDD